MEKYTYQDLIDFFEDTPEVQNSLIQERDSGRVTEKQESTLYDTLDRSFIWMNSYKGYSYWVSVHQILRDYERQTQGSEGK